MWQNMNLFFCMCLDVYKSYKFIQSFQVDLVRHVLLCTSNSKWWVNHITGMGLKYVDCLHVVKHLQMDLFGLVHAYGFSQVSLSMLIFYVRGDIHRRKKLFWLLSPIVCGRVLWIQVWLFLHSFTRPQIAFLGIASSHFFDIIHGVGSINASKVTEPDFCVKSPVCLIG